MAAANQARRIGIAFFWQLPGALGAYLVALLLTSLEAQFQFRLIFGLGALPALGILFLNRVESAASKVGANDSPESSLPSTQPTSDTRSPRGGPVLITRDLLYRYRWALMGNCGAWYLFDVAYYGTLILVPQIVAYHFPTASLAGTAWRSLVITASGIPGCLITLCLIGRQVNKRLFVCGFVLDAVLFAVNALVGQVEVSAETQLILLMSLVCVLSGGPAVSTFVLPAVCFPSEVRSTLHGLCAFCGKLGAVTGVVLLVPMERAGYGYLVLMLNCLACMLGCMVSMICLKHDWEYVEEHSRHQGGKANLDKFQLLGREVVSL